MAIYIIIPVFIIAIHLFAVAKGYNALKSTSKIFLIPYIYLAFSALCGTLGIYIPHEKLLIAVMICYTLGDLLLEIPEAFIAGGLSFAVGHVLYATYFLLNGYSIILSLVFVGIWAFIYIFLFEPELKYIRPNSTQYLLYALFVAILGIAVGSSNFGENWLAKMIAVGGTFSFAFSDALVILRATRDKDDPGSRRKDDVLIMVTYLGANILLLAGILLNLA